MEAFEKLLGFLLNIADFFTEIVLGLLLASCRKIDLPRCFADWVNRQMPALGGISDVVVHCCDTGDLPLGPLFEIDGTDGITFDSHVAL